MATVTTEAPAARPPGAHRLDRRLAPPPTTTAPTPKPPAANARHALRSRCDPPLLLLLVLLTCLVEYVLRAAAQRPLWYDELWRAHYISAPLGQFWTEIRLANTPSAVGWLLVERLFGTIFGYSPWVLRVPQLVMLPVLAAVTYGLARRFTVPGGAFAVAVLVTFGGKMIDLGTQLKPYTTEAACAVLMVGLWCSVPPLAARANRWFTRRTLTGVLSLFFGPALFLLVPLAASDFLLARGDLKRRLKAFAGAVPALLLCAAHSLIFVRRQSVQRGPGTFWNKYFLADRGILGGLRFIGVQMIHIAGSVPPGADRSDINLVHAPTDSTPLEVGVLAPAFLILFILGTRVLLRRHDGRVLVTGLLGSELVILAASAARYWSFGPTRTNAFLVPLLTLVPAVGLIDLVRRARRERLLVLPAVALAGVVLMLAGSVAVTTHRFYVRRSDPRLSDGLPLAADAVRRELRPGDLVLVAGGLARPGWIYSVDVREARPRDLPPLSEASTVFVDHGGDGRATAALQAHHPRPDRLLFFVFGVEPQTQRPELQELRGQGWCPEAPARDLADAGRLLTLMPCSR